MRISELARDLPTSPIRKLTPHANQAKARGLDVIHLNIGQPDIETPTVFAETVAATVRDMKIMAYMDSAGYYPLREAMSAYFARSDVHFGPDQIRVTNGGSEALAIAVQIVCDPDTEILVPEPFYSNYLSFTMPYRVGLSPIPTDRERGFHLPDKETIAACINSRTRAFLISNPSNPTGTVYRREELARIAELAVEHDLWVIADELYREFAYDGEKAESLASFPEIADRLILIDSVSKGYSGCGIRIGCLAATNEEVLDAALRICQGRLSAPSLEMVGATSLYRLPSSFFLPIRARYEERRNTLINGLKSIPGVTANLPEGAFYTIARLPVPDSEDFARWLLTDYEMAGRTLMVTPAGPFYLTPGVGQNEIRLAYVRDLPDLENAIRILEDGLARYRQEKGLQIGAPA